ncbi:MAG: AarF/ABC1/UbiB kinase family protein, partial [Chloroflexi bacterium]|nr:AarF/ABC1/UbiB kinase family protein [Chloroflexota bacterium]
MLTHRYRRIVLFFARVIAALVWWELLLPRFGLREVSARTRAKRLRALATRYRALANDLGGLTIKLGQFFSARVDVLPEEITSELAALQDEVRAENFADIRRAVERELGALIAARFIFFDETPLAAASLGQVHRAQLAAPSNGVEKIVVKVQRPNIHAIVATDLAAIRTVINWVQHYPPIRKRANLPRLLDEFTRVVEGELDYLAEGKNAETFAENFRDEARVRVPRVIWTHTTKRVLALEDVYAIKITDYAAITAAGVDRAEVAERLFEIYLKQIFRDGFFHADPHPGNLFVEPVARESPRMDANENIRAEWRLTFVDFGMAGNVAPNVSAGLRELAIALGTRDAARMIKGYQMLGVLLPGADLQLLEKMEQKVFERFWGMTMGELRAIGFDQLQDFAHEFRELMFAMPFQAPQDLILLGRTVAILSGMCTGLNPQFNVWAGLAPFAQELLAEEGTSRWTIIRAELERVARALFDLPLRADAVLNRIERGDLEVKTPQL